MSGWCGCVRFLDVCLFVVCVCRVCVYVHVFLVCAYACVCVCVLNYNPPVLAKILATFFSCYSFPATGCGINMIFDKTID